MPGYQDLSDYLDQLEGRAPPPGSGVMADPFGGTPTGTSTPADLSTGGGVVADPFGGTPTGVSSPAPELAALPRPAPRAQVSKVGDMARPAPFQSLASAAPSDAGGPPTPAPGASGDDELKTAQAQDARNATLHSLGQGYTRMADLILGRQNPTQVDAPTTSAAKDLLARRDAARQATADAAQKDLNDPNSPISKRAQLLAAGLMKSAGMDPTGVTGMSAADVSRFKDMLDKGMSVQQAKAALEAENTRAANSLASEEKRAAMAQQGENARAAAQRGTQLTLERERMAAEQKMHSQDIEERHQAKMEEQAAKKGATANGKPLDTQDLMKVSGADVGADAALRQWDAFDKVGGFGLVGPDSSKYQKNRQSDAMQMAIARNPMAREVVNQHGVNPDEYTPLPSDTKGTGAFKIGKQLEAIRGGLESRIKTLGAAGVDVTPLKDELGRIAKTHSAFLSKASEHLGAVSVRSPDGRTITMPAKDAAKFAADPRFSIGLGDE